MVICGMEAAPVFPAQLVCIRFAEYVDEISRLGRLRAVFVMRPDSRADGGHVGAGGERLIFNRRPELCRDALTHPTRLREFIPPG